MPGVASASSSEARHNQEPLIISLLRKSLNCASSVRHVSTKCTYRRPPVHATTYARSRYFILSPVRSVEASDRKVERNLNMLFLGKVQGRHSSFFLSFIRSTWESEMKRPSDQAKLLLFALLRSSATALATGEKTRLMLPQAQNIQLRLATREWNFDYS